MEDATTSNRRNKRVDASTSEDEPVQKSARSEVESTPVLSKKELELEKRLTEVSKQLKEARRNAVTAFNKERELALVNIELKLEMGNLKRKEEDATRMYCELTHENAALKRELDEMKRKAVGDRMRDQERIDDLTHKLTQFEGQPYLQQLQQPESTHVAQQVLISPEGKEDEDEKKEEEGEGVSSQMCTEADHPYNPFNIFQLLEPDAPDTISLDIAVALIRSKLEECGEQKFWLYCGDIDVINNGTCEVCERGLTFHRVPNHFLSPGHIEKVRARNAAVSLPAVQHWMSNLQYAIDGLLM